MGMLFPMSQEFRLTFPESLKHTLISLIINAILEMVI